MKKKLRIHWFFTLVTSIFLFWLAQKIDWHHQVISGCPYCEPEIHQRQMIHEGSHASVIITYKPAVYGHLLIIPKRHVERYDLLSPSEILEMGELVKKIHTMYCQKLNADDYLLIQKNGRMAGQSVPHVHIHILPRTAEIGIVSFIFRLLIMPHMKQLNAIEMETYCKKMSFI